MNKALRDLVVLFVTNDMSIEADEGRCLMQGPDPVAAERPAKRKDAKTA